ncbi:MAG: TauD/TfdA family dioxygenase, partial [Alphaproteobacteria bacterium]
YLQMAFEPGDVQIIHNHQILHNRTAYEDWDDPDQRRYLLRLWLSPPDGITLLAAFAERYGSITPGDRGGVVVAGTQLHAPLEAM